MLVVFLFDGKFHLCESPRASPFHLEKVATWSALVSDEEQPFRLDDLCNSVAGAVDQLEATWLEMSTVDETLRHHQLTRRVIDMVTTILKGFDYQLVWQHKAAPELPL